MASKVATRAAIAAGMIALGAALTPAAAQAVKIERIEARLFLEGRGALSDNILGLPPTDLVDLPRGGRFGEPANSLIFLVTLSGPRNTQPRFANAIVNLGLTGRNGQRRSEARALEGFAFGESGRITRAVVVDNATCLTRVEIEVVARRERQKAEVGFTCADPERPAATPPRR